VAVPRRRGGPAVAASWRPGRIDRVTERTEEMLLDPGGVQRLRDALAGADYTSAGIAARLGEDVAAALGRGDARAALRLTTGREPLDTLIRLFACQRTEPADTVAAALSPLALTDAVEAGLVEPDSDGMRAGVDLEPYGPSWWVLADLPASARPGRPLPADHVLGVGAASETLAGATVRTPVGTALDLGTGCGVQALHLSGHAGTVTATDVSERALRFAATTAALNGLDWELLRGDLAAPVAGRRFDLVVSNPPFVVGPGVTTHTYRDSGRPGDAVSAELVAAAPGLLADGGTMQFLANWAHVAGEDWGERVAGWLAGTGLDAWVIQREVADPLAYVNLWLVDAAEAAHPARRDRWLDWFAAHKVEGVGFGLVTLRRSGRDEPVVRVEDLRQQVEPPFGAEVAAWFDRQDWLRERDARAVLAARFRAADGLTLRQDAKLGDGGWVVDRQVLVQPRGLRWSEEVDPLVLALVGGCDGTVALRDQLAVLAVAHDADEDALAEVAVPIVAHLVERGIILPVAG
jgi:methylase of polypeptide subunit release factors